MVEDILPIIADIPRNLAWSVDFDRHHLTETPALNQHDSSPDTTTAPASIIALLDLSRDKRIAACHISSRNDVCAFNGESMHMRFSEEKGIENKKQTYCRRLSAEDR